MPQTLDLSARNIVRFARKNGITMKHFSYHFCALGVVYRMAGLDPLCTDFQELADAINRTEADVANLEAGFEGWSINTLRFEKNRYYEVGARVAKLVGL